MSLPSMLLVHTVTVETYEGTGAHGPVYGAPWTLQCMAQGKHRLVRDSDGAERVSSLTLYAAAGQRAVIPPGSRVTWQGDTTTVLESTDHDTGGLAPEGDHTEVVCE